jgi:hypothetical protein
MSTINKRPVAYSANISYAYRIAISFAVMNSPRLGAENETFVQIIIAAHGYPNGILKLSNETVEVAANYNGPLLFVIRTAGVFGSVSYQF